MLVSAAIILFAICHSAVADKISRSFVSPDQTYVAALISEIRKGFPDSTCGFEIFFGDVALEWRHRYPQPNAIARMGELAATLFDIEPNHPPPQRKLNDQAMQAPVPQRRHTDKRSIHGTI